MNRMAGFAVAGAVAVALTASATELVSAQDHFNLGNTVSNEATEGVFGMVVDSDGQPVADAIVSVGDEQAAVGGEQGAFGDECHDGGISGGGQHVHNAARVATTDKHGRFHLLGAKKGAVIFGHKKGVGTGTATTTGVGAAVIKLHKT